MDQKVPHYWREMGSSTSENRALFDSVSLPALLKSHLPSES
jgi:hypothetical protein